MASVPPAGVEHVRTLETVEEYRLTENGLRILLIPSDGLPVASVMVTYEVGSRNEVTGTTGATHILEHMMFHGTERFDTRDGNDYSSTMERIGARSNATTYFDRTNYYATLPRQYVPLAIELEADRMRGLLIREDDLASEMTVVRNEFEQGENNPVRTLIKEIYAAAFMAQPYGHPTIGWLSDIENTNPEKLRDFYDRFYWPENAVLSVIGGFDRTETLEAIKRYYGPVPPAPTPIPTVDTVEPEQLGPRRVVIERSGQVGVVMIAYKVPEGLHQDWAALKVIEEIVGANQTGRLYRALEDQGKASATFTFGPQLRDPGLFMFAAFLTPTATHEETETIILAEIEKLIADGVSEEELERAKSVVRASTIYGRDGPFAIADEINEFIAMGDWTNYIRQPQAIQEVTASDVQRVAERYFRERRSTTGWFVPARPAQALAQAGAGAGPIYYRDPHAQMPAAEMTSEINPAATAETEFTEPEMDFAANMESATVAGIEVVGVHMPIEGVVSFVGSFAAGDALSPEDAPSLASLTAAMLDQGTQEQDRFALAEQLANLGAQISFSSDSHSLQFSGRLLRNDAGSVMALLAEKLREPAFDPDVFAPLKSRLHAGLLNAIDNPDFRARTAVSRLLYPEGHPNYTEEIEKLLEELEATTAEDLAAFHNEHYGPRSMRLVFAGDFDFEELTAAIETAFANWEGGVDYPEITPEPLEGSARIEEIFIADRTSVAVRYGYHTGLQRTDEDYLPFMVGNYILGANFNSRLMTEIRQKRGLTYGIRSGHEGDILTPGHWTLTTSFGPAMVDEGIQATDTVVTEWHAEGVREDEVAAAIQTLTGSYLVGLSTTARVAHQVLSFMQRGFEPEYIDQYPKDLLEITPEAVNAAIRRYFEPAAVSKAIAGTLENHPPANEQPPMNLKTDAHTSSDSSADTRTVQVRLDAPDAAWRVQIERVYRTADSLVVISRLSRTDGMAAQVISAVSDQVEISAEQTLPIRHYILGKTWKWGDKGNYVFIDSEADLGDALANAEQIYERTRND